MDQDDRSVTANQIRGPIYGAAVQADRIEGGVHFHAPHGDAEPPAPLEPPTDWTALPELPSEVRFLLRARVDNAHVLPYRLRGARQSSLATVYVRQELGTGPDEQASEQRRPTPILDGRGQLVDAPSSPVVRLTVRPPSRPVRKALDDHDHLLVTGGPGQGKSTLSLRLAADVASRWLSPSAEDPPLAEPVVPIRLTARELATRLELPFPEAVQRSVGAEYGALLEAPLEPKVLRQRVAGCRWLLLVDGVDEVADGDERNRLVAVLARWASDTDSPYRVVLTTRPIEGAALAPLQRIGASRYELQPFDEEALRRFAGDWFDDADQGQRFVRQIRAAHLDELVRVPLLATIAAIIYEQYGDRPLPDNQYELYESYLRYLRTGHATASRFESVHAPLLEHLGRVRLEVDTSLVAAAQDWAAAHLTELAGEWREELTTYLAAVGPLVRRGDDLRFLHHSFAEHLAATAQARLLPECFDPDDADFAACLHAARPEVSGRHARAVLLHHSRLHVAEADRLLRWLHAGGADQHLLAARLLAWHLPASPGVVDAFLTTVRSWAMSTLYSAPEILAQTSRAAHHPGIVAWLSDLMCDDLAPWPSRVEAAAALATRLRGPGAADAAALLRTVVDDAAIPVNERLAAAEALSDCGARERESSERGLRSVLADPAASVSNCRTAAVVLAGFDGPARVCAVEALNAILADPWSPDDELAEAATGLVEIGIEFHERCAEVFRGILLRRTNSTAGLRAAAVGLASLGPSQLTEAVIFLTRLVTDRRVGRSHRISVAETLAKLGPQHRAAAGEHLLAMTEEIDVESLDRWSIASSLVDVGFHDDAANLLHKLVADREANPSERLWASETLSELGPDHYAEAACALRHFAAHPRTGRYGRTTALARLAGLGEPHRTTAVAALRGWLTARAEEPESRCDAAVELTRLGPEFHGEAADCLLEIVSTTTDPHIRVMAWRALRNLSTEFHDQASMALRALMGPDEAESWEAHRRQLQPNGSDFGDHEAAAHGLVAILADATRGCETRMRAAIGLVRHGRRFHRTALDGVLELFCSRALPLDELQWMSNNFAKLGSAPRAELAEALRAQTRHQHRTAAAVCKVAQALELLDYRADPETVAALRNNVADELSNLDERGDAAVALARAVPEELTDVTALVVRSHGDSVYRWEQRVRKLAALGADVVPGLRALLLDVDTERGVRHKAAVLLAALRPDLHGEALTEVRTQADDEFLQFSQRSDAVLSLVRLDPARLDDVIAYHRTVLDDERQSIASRWEAADELNQLDESCCEVAMTALRRFAAGREFTVEERANGVYWFGVNSGYERELAYLALGLARDPTARPRQRSWVKFRLSGRARAEVEQSLLADRCASPEERVDESAAWEYRTFGANAEAVLRDVLTAVETSPAERVKAATVLGKLSPRHVPEAVSLLEELAAGRCAVAEARAELCDLSQEARRRVLSDAQRVVADETCSWRRRVEVAELICAVASDPPHHVLEHLRQVTRDRRTADRVRLRILYTLRRVDGLGRIREIRDDERVPPAIRRAAANRLRDHAVADRAAAARILTAVATDRALRPALRWRAAHDLTQLGERGRELGVAALRVIRDDESLPVIARVNAAGALGDVRPDLRVDVLRLLRSLRTTPAPLARIQVFEAIGRFDPTEGALGLQDMASDPALTVRVRLRAADAMQDLHRDYREKAAIVAREVANDKTAPIHIRAKAARALARWSDLCRGEAQALLVELNESALWNRGQGSVVPAAARLS